MSSMHDMDAWAATLNAHHDKLYEELVAEVDAELATEKDPFERKLLMKRRAELDAIQARSEASR